MDYYKQIERWHSDIHIFDEEQRALFGCDREEKKIDRYIKCFKEFIYQLYNEPGRTYRNPSYPMIDMVHRETKKIYTKLTHFVRQDCLESYEHQFNEVKALYEKTKKERKHLDSKDQKGKSHLQHCLCINDLYKQWMDILRHQFAEVEKKDGLIYEGDALKRMVKFQNEIEEVQDELETLKNM